MAKPRKPQGKARNRKNPPSHVAPLLPQKKGKTGNPRPHTVFRRIIVDPAHQNGRAHVVRNKHVIFMDDVVDLLKKGCNDNEIRAHFQKAAKVTISDADFHIFRAWQARFAPGTLSKEFNRVGAHNIIMLDENMPASILYGVVKIFGRSSHVTADGLFGDNNNDEKHIWAHMVDNGYKAIITADSDFIDISRRHRERVYTAHGKIKGTPVHTPVVIRIKGNHSREGTLNLIAQYQKEIFQFIRTNDAVCLQISATGAIKIEPDAAFLFQGKRNHRPGKGPKHP